MFTRTKHGAERLARQLTEAGIPAAELHGNLRQGARSRNLAAFASGLARVMVATDIAARGIHIDGIDLVIHADPPAEHKAYVHRSGRTARGGADGVVVTLQTKSQARDVTAMMRKADITPHAAVAADAGLRRARRDRRAAGAPGHRQRQGLRARPAGGPAGQERPARRRRRPGPRPRRARDRGPATAGPACGERSARTGSPRDGDSRRLPAAGPDRRARAPGAGLVPGRAPGGSIVTTAPAVAAATVRAASRNGAPRDRGATAGR